MRALFVGVLRRCAPERAPPEPLCTEDFVTVEELCDALLRAYDACAEAARSRSPVSLITCRAVRLLKKHYAAVDALDVVTRELCATPRYLRRVFAQDMGIGVHAYLTTLRVGHAKALLRAGMPAKQVGVAVGIADADYFCKYFKKHTGQTPGVYAALKKGPSPN